MKLTEQLISSALRKEKPYKIYGGAGVYIEIPPRGNPRWRFKYRFSGKEKKLSLGVFPLTNLKEAIQKSEAFKKLLADGVDPAQYNKQQKMFSKNDSSHALKSLNETVDKAITNKDVFFSKLIAAEIRKILFVVCDEDVKSAYFKAFEKHKNTIDALA